VKLKIILVSVKNVPMLSHYLAI